MSTLPTILIIEDQKFCTDLFRAAFSHYPIFVAHTGQAGISLYHQHHPNIVFLDIGLPDISGFHVLKTLRDHKPNAYIVMLSAMNNDAYIRKCKTLGAAGFLTKPYRKENIEHYIGRYRELGLPIS